MIKTTQMSFIKIYIHLVFSTRNRMPYLNTFDTRVQVWRHIKGNASEKNIYLDMVNGYSDHCHCLISLRSDQNIEKVAQLLKGESSRWINKNKLTEDKFSWQKEYFAVSVSESKIEVVRKYIKNQEKHHHKKTFADEYQEIVKKYNINDVNFG